MSEMGITLGHSFSYFHWQASRHLSDILLFTAPALLLVGALILSLLSSVLTFCRNGQYRGPEPAVRHCRNTRNMLGDSGRFEHKKQTRGPNKISFEKQPDYQFQKSVTPICYAIGTVCCFSLRFLCLYRH